MGLFFRLMICFWLPLILFSIIYPSLVLLQLHWPACYSFPAHCLCLFPFPFSSQTFMTCILTFRISDQMLWERMSQITLSKIKPILLHLPHIMLFFFFFKITLNTMRHCLFPLQCKSLEGMLALFPGVSPVHKNSVWYIGLSKYYFNE